MAMTPEEMAKFVNDLYASSGAGDWATANAMLTDDLVIVEAEGLPYAGTYSGNGALQELFTVVMGQMDVAGINHLDLTCGTDYAVAILEMQFADPSLKPAELCEMFKFRDGKVCEIKPYYFDPAPIVAACEAKKALA